MMAVYYVVFTTIRVNPIPDYWIYLSSALFPFNFLLSNLTAGTGAVTDNASMVKKIYFPREILVLFRVISSFIIMVLGYAVVTLLIIIVGNHTSLSLLLVPVVLLLMIVFAIGFVMLLSSVGVYVRDLRHFINSISMVFMFTTPMYFLASSTSGILETLIWCNPMTYYVEFLHCAVYSGVVPDLNIFLPCAIMPVVSLLVGYFVFRRLKSGFAERL